MVQDVRNQFKTKFGDVEGNVYVIPLMVNKLITEGTATCEVLDTTSKWFGVTYAADRDATVARIQKLVDDGVYPNKLF